MPRGDRMVLTMATREASGGPEGEVKTPLDAPKGVPGEAKEPTKKKTTAPSDAIKGVEAEIEEVKQAIKDVQALVVSVGLKIDETREKIEKTKIELKQKNLTELEKEILMLDLKSLMDEKKALMDKENNLIDEKNKRIDETANLKYKNKAQMPYKSLKISTSSFRLAEKKVVATNGEAVISLPRQGVMRKYLKYDRIFVRDFYDRFIEEYLDNFDNKDSDGAVIMGTPGIGKSSFAWYVVWKALQMGKSVIYHGRHVPTKFLVFHNDSPVEVYQEFPTDYDETNNVYVVDSLEPESTLSYTVFVTSPERELVKEYLKFSVKELYFPIYTLDELKLMRDFCFDGKSSDTHSTILTDQELEHRFNDLFGGVPRFALSDYSKKRFNTIMGKMVRKATAQVKALDIGPEDLFETSHNIFHLIVSRDDFSTVEKLDFASLRASEMIADYDSKGKMAALRNLLDLGAKEPSFRSITGPLFEATVKKALPKMQFLEITAINGGNEITMALPGNPLVATHYFNNISEIVPSEKNLPKLWIPVSKNNPVFDVIIVQGADIYFVQITVSTAHEIVLRTDKQQGLLDVINTLQSSGFRVGENNNINFVWILPNKVFPDFRRKKVAKVSKADEFYTDQYLKEYKVALNADSLSGKNSSKIVKKRKEKS